MAHSTVIVWYRNDLRLDDNPALAWAAQHAERIVPLYLHASQESGKWPAGAASRWWLHHSLGALDKSLRTLGSRLVVRSGPGVDTLLELAGQCGATSVVWNRRYESAHIRYDKRVKRELAQRGIECHSFGGALLFEPWTIATGSGGPYRVFTPYWKTCRRLGLPDDPTAAPAALPPAPRLARPAGAASISELDLLPRIRWDRGLREAWQAGEDAAHARLDEFCGQSIADYPALRDIPGQQGTTRLSAHLHYGEISPRRCVQRILQTVATDTTPGLSRGAEVLLSELGWREFAHHVLYHFPHTSDQPLNERYCDFPWRRGGKRLLRAWQQGLTGVPIVDAGMRELWHSGWMHNRVRMIVASFLTKNCRLHWRDGARWFWDTLVDADLANNTLNWQWAAGCGADAAPYFRIFNPVTQGNRFDADGIYVRRWVPELAALPNRWLHEPWNAPPDVLAECNVRLG
ncbi:MAG: deoxyribodipyrimidine photo-lyase, partial [Pseudomonadota bacterium]